jgi:hypothetical protein
MTTKAYRTSYGTLFLAASTLALTIACDQSRAEAGEMGEAAPLEAKSPTGDKATTPRVDRDHFIAELKSVGTAKAGQKSTVEVVIEPKGAYKINDKYPTKLSLKETQGIAFEKAVLRKEDGKFSDKKGTFRVSFTPAAAGKTTVRGKLSMSVCSDENCLMEKVELALDVDVQK